MSKKSQKITTQTKRKKKPHDKFRLRMELDSTPVQLDIKADSTETKIKDLTPNPYKYSFGKVRFPHGVVEACIYVNPENPQKMPNSAIWYAEKDHFAKGKGFITDLRRLKEIQSLRERVRYFLALTKKRKLQYLRKKGFLANIDSRKAIHD